MGFLCTKETSYTSGNWLGIGDNVTVIDTPGFDLLDENYNMLLDDMITVLQEIGSINTFILMIKGDDNRNKQTGQFPSGMINMIKFLEAVYGKVLWKNTIISVSNWGYSSFDIADRRDIYQSEALL